MVTSARIEQNLLNFILLERILTRQSGNLNARSDPARFYICELGWFFFSKPYHFPTCMKHTVTPAYLTAFWGLNVRMWRKYYAVICRGVSRGKLEISSICNIAKGSSECCCLYLHLVLWPSAQGAHGWLWGVSSACFELLWWLPARTQPILVKVNTVAL